MSRVERTENPGGRADAKRGSEQSREAQRGRSENNDATPRPTPTKAEGEVGDVEQALEHQNE